MKINIAYVDIDKKNQDTFQLHLSKYYNFQTFTNPMDCLHEFKKNKFPIILSEIDLYPINGIEFLQKIEKLNPYTLKILLMNGKKYHHEKNGHKYPTIHYDSSQLDIERIHEQIDSLIINYQKHPLKSSRIQNNIPEIVGTDFALISQLSYARRIANSQEPVLICGETGTGKDLMAKYIHYHSNRENNTFQIVNCAAIKPELFESEFFGHVKGAFTGAAMNNRGHFRRADHGTLVLDEISELDKHFQVKLLRAIENQEIYPVGSQRIVKLDVRITTLTNKDLVEEIKAGKFRSDLYYRLNKYKINLPPLRKRLDDFRLLVEHFLRNSWFSLIPKWQQHIDTQIYEFIQQIEFPGNIRDLQNLVAKVLSFKTPANPELTLHDFEKIVGENMLKNKNLHKRESLKVYLERMERTKILEELNNNHYNISQTARYLGLSRQGLQQRLRKLQIEVPNR